MEFDESGRSPDPRDDASSRTQTEDDVARSQEAARRQIASACSDLQREVSSLARSCWTWLSLQLARVGISLRDSAFVVIAGVALLVALLLIVGTSAILIVLGIRGGVEAATGSPWIGSLAAGVLGIALC